MALVTLPFFRGYSATADANGNATITAGPAIANEAWHIETMSGNNPGPRTPTVYVYKNVVAPSGFIDGTLNGLFAQTNTPVDLLSSETIIWVWSLCTPGTLCQVTFRGERQVNM